MAAATVQGGVTGERLEFRVPASVFTELRQSNARAVCFPDGAKLAANLAAMARNKARRSEWAAGEAVKEERWSEGVRERLARKATRSAGVGSSLSQLAAEMQAGLGRLRGEGVEGPVPVCLYRGSGKQAQNPRESRRTEAVHERFHADVQRHVFRLGASLDFPPCGQLAKQKLLDETGPGVAEAYRAAVLKGWRPALEEMLARTEEIRKSCLRSEAQCLETKQRFEETLLAAFPNRSPAPDALARAEVEIRERYGSAPGFVTQALRACVKAGLGRG